MQMGIERSVNGHLARSNKSPKHSFFNFFKFLKKCQKVYKSLRILIHVHFPIINIIHHRVSSIA